MVMMTSSVDLPGNLRMVFDRNAAAVVGDGQEAFGVEMDLDEVGVAGHRLVHRVVDDFGEEVVQRLFVGAADIHARTHANRLEAFENADRGRVVVCRRRRMAARGAPAPVRQHSEQPKRRRARGLPRPALAHPPASWSGAFRKRGRCYRPWSRQIFILSWGGRLRLSLTQNHRNSCHVCKSAESARKHLDTRRHLIGRSFH